MVDFTKQIQEKESNQLYNSPIFNKLVQFMIISGGKIKAQRILHKSITEASKKLGESELTILEKVLMNVSPDIEVKSKKIGTTSYMVPKPINSTRKLNLGVKLLLESANQRKENGIVSCLTNEFIEAFNNKGSSVKKKDDIHKQAEANKSFSHFNW